MYKQAEDTSHQECPSCQTPSAMLSSEAPTFCPRCRFPLLLVAHKYQLTRLLSKGGFGEVYLARHTTLASHAARAIKIINPRHNNTVTKERFHREVQLTAQLSKQSPHIVHLHDDFGECPHLGYYYVMEYLEGPSLRAYIDAHPQGSIPLHTIKLLLQQLCDAIQTAHEHDIIHRDLKPENILVTTTKTHPLFLKVIDFGIAKPIQQNQQGITDSPIGTPAYMAPEQCLNRTVDERTDVYAIATIFHELLTGSTPFPWQPPSHKAQMELSHDLFWAQLHQPLPSLHTRFPERQYPEAVETILQRALAKTPAERFPSAKALSQAIAQLPDELPTPSPTNLPQPSSWRTQEGPHTPSSWLKTSPPPHKPPSHKAPIPTPSHQTPTPSHKIPQPTYGAPIPTHAHQTPTPLHEALPPSPSSPQADSTTPAKHRTYVASLVLALTIFGFFGGRWLWYTTPTQTMPLATQKPANQTHPSGQSPQPQTRHTPPKAPNTIEQRSPTRQSTKRQTQPNVPKDRQRSTLHYPKLRRKRIPKPTKLRRKTPLASPPKSRRLRHPRRSPTAGKMAPRPRVRRAPRKTPKALVRLVDGCPKSPLYWVYVHMTPSQRKKARPILPSGGRMVPHAKGFCFGVNRPKAHILLGNSGHNYIPCQLAPAHLPPKVKLTLQKEGRGLEPEDKGYCVHKSKGQRSW